MKKLVCLLLVVSLFLSGAVCVAAELYGEEYTDVPSVATQDSVRALTVDPQGAAEALSPDAQAVAQLEELYNFVWEEKNRPVRYYDEETQEKIQALIPDVDSDALYMSEFMRLQLSMPEADDLPQSVAMRMELEPDYTPGRLIVVVMGFLTDDGTYRWFEYRGNVPETGVICWDMPMEEFTELAKQDVLTHVLTVHQGGGSAQSGHDAQPEATAQPSIQARDLTVMDGWKSVSGAEIDDTFRIAFVDLTSQMQDELVQMEEFLEEGHAPMEWFPEEIRERAQTMKQDNVQIDEMIVYDVTAVTAENYKDTYDDVATQSRFPTSYSADREMFALLGFWTEDNQFEWHYLRTNAAADVDSVEIVYPQLTLPMMETQPALLMVFSEPLTEGETKE